MSPNRRHIIRLTVREVAEYCIDLDRAPEILGDPEALDEWLEDNADVWTDECHDGNYYGCEEREITECDVVAIRREKAA